MISIFRPKEVPHHGLYSRIIRRRISLAMGRPITKVIAAVFEAVAQILDEKKICEKCRDPKCQREQDCIFKSGRKVALIDLSTIQKEEPKVKEVAVMASKKIGSNLNLVHSLIQPQQR